MNDLKKDPMDPELYWPEAENLLEKHYTTKRRRRGIVLFGVVIVGLLTVFLISSNKENFSEKMAPAKIEKGEEPSIVNRNHATHETETLQPSKEEKGITNSTEIPSETDSPIFPKENRVTSTNKEVPVSPTKVKQNFTNTTILIVSTEINSSFPATQPSEP